MSAATTAFQPTPAHQLREDSADLQVNAKTSYPSSLSGPVEADLSFFVPPEDGSAPYNWAGTNADNPPNGIPRNFGYDSHVVKIQDIRGKEGDFTLDKNAFEALRNVPSQMEYDDWNHEEKITGVYYPEVEQLLLDNLPGSHRIFLFDHTIRRPGTNRSAVTRVHIDQTAKSTAARVSHHLPDDAEELLRGRYRIVNVWRPLNGPVQTNPLAVADSATVLDEDLVPVEHRYPDRNGETAGVKYNEGQKWYYLSGMENNERLFLKCYDSDETVGKYGRVPHTAFDDPRTPKAAPGRESIEVRALVFG